MPNNLKQLALGCLHHEQATRRYPTGGWGWAWVGDADRGTDWRQPGGWIYNILPFIEQQPLHDMGMGLTGTAKNDANGLRSTVALNVYFCPSRRPPLDYPYVAGLRKRKSDSAGDQGAERLCRQRWRQL